MRSCPKQTSPPALVWSWTHDLLGGHRLRKWRNWSWWRSSQKLRRVPTHQFWPKFNQLQYNQPWSMHTLLWERLQNQQEQAGQSSERGPASHAWSHENHPSSWHGKKPSQCRAIWEKKKSQYPHSRRKTEKAAFPSSTHKPGTAHQNSPQEPKNEPLVQRTVQETPTDCGCANTAVDRSCLENR